MGIGIGEEAVFDLAEFFKVFSDPSRLKILYVLTGKEMSVSDIVAEVAMSQPAVSHQLRLLRQSGIVKGRRDGKNIIYSLDDGHVDLVFKQGLEHVMHKNSEDI